MYASGCAVGRCYPTYSMKTTGIPTREDVNVEFLVEGGNGIVPQEMREDELNLLQDSCSAIQLTSR